MTTDAVLPPSLVEEALSCVYARAVAARAGYDVATLGADLDSVDLKIQASGSMRPALDLQLKATVNLSEPRDGYVSFPLPLKNYNDLRIDTQTPRLLVVLDLPKDDQRWMEITEEELVLRRRAYWRSLKGEEETSNTSTVSVRIPATNLFNVESLRSLMDQSRTGSIQ